MDLIRTYIQCGVACALLAIPASSANGQLSLPLRSRRNSAAEQSNRWESMTLEASDTPGVLRLPSGSDNPADSRRTPLGLFRARRLPDASGNSPAAVTAKLAWDPLFVAQKAADGESPDAPDNADAADGHVAGDSPDAEKNAAPQAETLHPGMSVEYGAGEDAYWGVVDCDPIPIGKRLFPVSVGKHEKLSPITRVDLTEPRVAPHADFRSGHTPFRQDDFAPAPDYQDYYYDGDIELSPYYGKFLNPTERPWVELGRGLFKEGPIPESQTWLGKTNPVAPHFLVYGDFRQANGYVDNGNGDKWVSAYRLNLDIDLKITATERIHAFIGPLDEGANVTRVEYDQGRTKFTEQFDKDFDTIFFEGDLGALAGGAMGIYPPFDMPIAFGIMPMLLQNGVWLNDNFLGVAATIPARNAPKLQWSNYDITFFAGFDEINSDAFPGDDSQADMFGVHAFIEAYEGYLEVGYAYLDDVLGGDLSYHNIGISFSRRYLQRFSNSIRFIANVGQDPSGGAQQTADGQLVLFETALITADYTHVVPYLNMFAGFDRPQSVARAGGVGVLVNTGINFETDGVIGFPKLDDSANDTYGGAIGLNLLGPDLRWQLVTELAVVATHGNDDTRKVPGDQYALGMRFQKPLTNAWIFRADGIYGVREQLEDLSGARIEMRYKF